MRRARINRTQARNDPPRLGDRVTLPRVHNAAAGAGRRGHVVPWSKRAKGGRPDEQLPFVPPEDWHEPSGRQGDYKIIVQNPGVGYRHVVTPREIRQRLARVPEQFVRSLEVIQLSAMTRKKQSLPCYGMQWGAALYLYPMEAGLVEYYDHPPRPEQLIEAGMYGGRWVQEGSTSWELLWSEEAIKSFYLDNILIHELGHLLDNRNSSYVDRERFAEWFALRYGRQSSATATTRGPVRRRHHSPRRV